MARHRFDLDPGRSQVWIEGTSSIHPIKANASGLVGWVELDLRRSGSAVTLSEDPSVAGEVRIEVDRLRSGNPLVDRETRRRIDAGRYPEIVGRVTASRRRDDDSVGLDGEIDFRGETVAVSGDLDVHVDGDTIHLRGSRSFDVRDWGLEPPKVGFVKVHPTVEVRFEAEGTRTGEP